jgi:hypothetical protein
MSVADAIATIIGLNTPERARAVQEIMESFVEPPLTESEREHLARIMAQEAVDQNAGRQWEEIEAELVAQESS